MVTPSISNTYTNKKALRLYPRTWRGWLLLIFVILLLTITCAYFLARQTPGWYQPLSIQSDQVLDAADAAQEKIRQIALDLHNTLGKLPLGDQEWSITQDEVNSLLAVRFANYHPIAIPETTSQTPDHPPESPAHTPENPAKSGLEKELLSGPLVRFTPGKVTCGGRMLMIPSGDSAGGVLTVVFEVGTTTGADGSAMGLIKMESVWAGLLPVPKFLLEGRIQAHVPSLIAAVDRAMAIQLGVKDSAKMLPQVEATINGISNGGSFPLNFTYEKQKVVVKEIRVEDGTLTIVFSRSVGSGQHATIQLK